MYERLGSMEFEETFGIIALIWLVVSFLLMARSIRDGRELAEELAATSPDRVEASDLLRARQTAAALLEKWDVPARTDRLYRELDLGEWSGLTREQIGSRDPEVALDVVKTAFDEGLVLLGAGRDPAKIRMLLPVNVTDEELEAGFAILEKALRSVSEARELPC